MVALAPMVVRPSLLPSLLAALFVPGSTVVSVGFYDPHTGLWENVSGTEGLCIKPQGLPTDWIFDADQVQAALCMFAAIYEEKGFGLLDLHIQCMSSGGMGLYPYCPTGAVYNFAVTLAKAEALFRKACPDVSLGSAQKLQPAFRYDILPRCLEPTPAPTPPVPTTRAPAVPAPTPKPTPAPLRTSATTSQAVEPIIETVVEGSLEMEVSDPASFIASSEAKEAVEAGIAEVSGVPVEAVEATLSISGVQGRRLEPAQLRRLAGTVIVDYIIRTSESTPSPNRIAATIIETPLESMTTVISRKVAVIAGPGAFEVVVVSASLPEIVERTLRPTTSTAPAEALMTTRTQARRPSRPKRTTTTKQEAVYQKPHGGLPCGKMPAAVCTDNGKELCVRDDSCSDNPPWRGGLGCNAGGVGQNCRFCGFDHFLPCEPKLRFSTSPPCGPVPQPVCASANEPCYLDYQCTTLPTPLVGVGCNAGGSLNCRFCGFGQYMPCPGPAFA